MYLSTWVFTENLSSVRLFESTEYPESFFKTKLSEGNAATKTILLLWQYTNLRELTKMVKFEAYFLSPPSNLKEHPMFSRKCVERSFSHHKFPLKGEIILQVSVRWEGLKPSWEIST